MIRCEHCDVDAYYNLTAEDFNDSYSVCNSLCIKCVKIEMKKIIRLDYITSIFKTSLISLLPVFHTDEAICITAFGCNFLIILTDIASNSS